MGEPVRNSGRGSWRGSGRGSGNCRGRISVGILILLILPVIPSPSVAGNFTVEVLGSENISGLDAIQFLIRNANYSAYNVSISLESEGVEEKVKLFLNETFFEFVNASSTFEVSFPLLVNEVNETERTNLTLRIDYFVYTNSIARKKQETFNFTFFLLPPSVPKIKASVDGIQGKSVYGKHFRIYLTNEGALARNVTISGNFQPEFALIPSIPPGVTVPLTLYGLEDTVYLVINLSYEYFNGTWVKKTETQRIPLRFDDETKNVLNLPGEIVVRKGKGSIAAYAFNPYVYPIDVLIESELFGEVPLGRLKPGESKALSLNFEIKKKFDRKRVKINGTVTILSPMPRRESFSKELFLITETEPEFEIRAKNDLLSNEEQILELSIKNTGKSTGNVRIILKPSFGIALKTKEAFIDELKSGEESDLKFRVSVGDLPPQSYALIASISCDGCDERTVVFGVDVLPNPPANELKSELSYFVIAAAILLLAFLARKIR